MSRNKDEQYFLIRADVLPDVFHKVMRVKELVDTGKVNSISEATKRVNLSRSAYYKYRAAVRAVAPEESHMTAVLLTMEYSALAVPNALACIQEVKLPLIALHSVPAPEGLVHIFLSFAVEPNTSEMRAVLEQLRQLRGAERVTQLT